METNELWVEIRNVHDVDPDGHPAELLRWLDDEAFPEQMALRWLRRLALLIPNHAVPIVSALRQAEADLQYRAERLDCLRWETTRHLHHPQQQPCDLRDFGTNDTEHYGWYAWLQSGERFQIADHRSINGDSSTDVELNTARAENEVTEELMFWIKRCLDVIPPHVQDLKNSLVSLRRELSRRNDDLAATFGPMF
jgi:hypothetical protein